MENTQIFLREDKTVNEEVPGYGVPELITKEDLALLKGLKERGLDTVEDLENYIRSMLMLRIMAVKAKGYMTEEDKEMIEFGMKAIHIQ